MIGVLVSLFKTPLSRKEKLFCMISYLPKATVQAAIGSIPFSMGLASGEMIFNRRRAFHTCDRSCWGLAHRSFLSRVIRKKRQR